MSVRVVRRMQVVIGRRCVLSLLFAGLSPRHSQMRLGRGYCCLSVFYEPQRESSELVALSSAAVAGADGQSSDAGVPSRIRGRVGWKENVFGFSYSASFKQLQLYWTQVRLTADGSEEQQRDGGLIA